MKREPGKTLARKNFFSSTITLALWRIRLNIGILILIGFGIITAVMLVCAVPLYSRVATTAGFRATLNADKNNPIVTVHASMLELSTPIVNDARSSIEQQIVNPLLGKYLASPVQFSVQSHDMKIISPAPGGQTNQMVLHGYDIKQLAAHAKLVQGRFPNQQSNSLEVIITPNTATALHIKVGSVITINFVAFVPYSGSQPRPIQEVDKNLVLHVVGLYTANIKQDAFWHDYDVNPVSTDPAGSLSFDEFTALVPNTTLLSTLDTLATQKKVGALETGSLIPDLYWYYSIDTSHLDISQFNDLVSRLNALQSQISTQSNLTRSDPATSQTTQSYDITGNAISVYGGDSILAQYQNRLNATQIPVNILMFQIISLILLFVAMMIEMLIERQQEAIALLGSRGANAGQIFGSFVAQGCGLGLIGLIIGPLLALPVVYALAQRILLVQGQGATNIITQDPIGILFALKWYALGAFFVIIATVSITTYLAFNYNILSLRRDTGRSNTRPLWQRFNLDIIAIIVALTAYGIFLYVTNVQNLDAHTYQLIITPLSLISPLFLLPAFVLFLLRLLPTILQLCARLVARGRGISAVIALGNMSRAPYQSMRMSLLLAFSISFAIFALVFNSTQVEHIAPVANYQVGADFSGPISASASNNSLADRIAAFKKIPGITSVTAGLTATVTTSNSANISLMAVDANTFAQTVYWPAQNSKESIGTLMHQLVEQRKDILNKNALPVIVDDLAAEQMGLSVGHSFNLQIARSDSVNSGEITVNAIAQVHHIPTIEDSTLTIDSSSPSLTAGILVDYQSYAALYENTFNTPTPTNYVWLRAKDDPTLLNTIRTTLTQKEPILNVLYDRYALMAGLNNDPLYLDVSGILAIGSVVALLLALVGNLQGLWFTIRKRKTNFVVLQALGTTQAQVAGILLWEQGIIYLVAIMLAIAIGILLSLTVVPALVLAATPASPGLSGGDFYAMQHIVPVQIVVPSALFMLLIALTIFCISTPVLIIRAATRSIANQQLRLNED